MAQSPYITHTVVLNTSVGNPADPGLGRALGSVPPWIARCPSPRPLSDIVSKSLSRQRLGMTLMLLFAVAALALAAVGIYGVIAYASSQRMGEVATRMALGATSSDAFWLLTEAGAQPGDGGTIVGLGVARAAGRAGSGLLYEVRATDPAILLSAAGVVVVITFLSILIPARRASRGRTFACPAPRLR